MLILCFAFSVLVSFSVYQTRYLKLLKLKPNSLQKRKTSTWNWNIESGAKLKPEDRGRVFESQRIDMDRLRRRQVRLFPVGSTATVSAMFAN